MAFDATDFRPATVDPRSLTTSRERLEYLERFLRALPAERFNLAYWFHYDGLVSFGWEPGQFRDETCATTMTHCGSCACIAGHTLAVFTPDAAVPERPASVAAAILGLDAGQAGDLFEPLVLGVSRSQITTTQAANVIAHLLATSDPGLTNGKVDWSKAGEP